jgi:putative peptidoglycan lipid II flippase
MSKKVASTLATAALLLVLLNLISKGLGFVREILFADYFGLGLKFDLYLVGAVLPLTINTIILNIAQNYFIPSYHQISQESHKLFFRHNFWTFTIISIFVSIVLFFLAPLLFSFYTSGVTRDELSTIIIVFKLLLISIPFTAGTSIFIAYLQAEFNFKTPAYSQLIVNVLFIFLLISLTGKIGILTIPVAYIFAIIFQWIFLLRLVPKLLNPFPLRIQELSKILKNSSGIIVPIVLIETIGQLYMLSDRYFYGLVDKGGIAALNYSYNLFLLPVSVLSFALTTVLFPKFSQTLGNNEKNEFQKSFNQGLEITVLIFIPFALLFFLEGGTIIKLLFEHGSFTSSSTLMTFSVLKIFSISLPIYAIYAIFNKVIYSIRKINSLLYITIFSLALKFVLNYLLVKNYRQDGLAISTIVSYFVFFLSSIFIIKDQTGRSPYYLLIKKSIFILLSVILSYIVANFFVIHLIRIDQNEGLVIAIIFLLVYYLSLSIMKFNALDSIHNLLVELFRKYFTLEAR